MGLHEIVIDPVPLFYILHPRIVYCDVAPAMEPVAVDPDAKVPVIGRRGESYNPRGNAQARRMTTAGFQPDKSDATRQTPRGDSIILKGDHNVLQLIFKKTIRETGETWSHEVPTPPADFMAEYEALPPRMMYGVDMGWKQSLSDSYAGASTEAEFTSSLDKKYEAFVNGTIRAVNGGGVVVRKTPLETEILRLAAEKVDERLKATNTKVSSANRSQLIEVFANSKYEEFATIAKENLAKKQGLSESAEIKATLAALFAGVDQPPAKKQASR